MWRPERFGKAASRAVGVVTGSPEFNVAIFGLLLNFVWEILQAPLYAGMADMPHAQVTKACLQATLGDMVILLLAFGVVAAAARSRRWVVAASAGQRLGFVAVGLVITAGIEWLATHGHWVQNWAYLPAMTLLPGTGIGIAPLLQWVLLPLLTVWFVRRQLKG